MTMQRRAFLRLLGGATALAGSTLVMGAIAGCASFEPRPFISGRAVGAPKGCQDLLARDPQGDC